MIDSPRNDPLADLGPATFEVLHERNKQKIIRYVARRVRNREATIDIVSEVWEVILQRFSKLPHPDNWNAFVWGVARNKVADWRRAATQKLDPIYLEQPELDRVAGEVVDEPELGQHEERCRLMKALNKAINSELTPSQREAVFLRYVDEMTIPEISNMMKVSTSVARKHVERGLKAARKSLAKAGFIVPKEAR